MKIDNIEKWTLSHLILRYIARFVHWIYYKKVTYSGIENIPEDKPILLAPNHQNALMDAIVTAIFLHHQPVFLARSDIFGMSDFITKLLLAIKILPVYRIRDGKEKLKLNEVIFQKSVDILEKKRMLVIFPEGTHTERRKFLTLQKGIARIAFQAEEKNNFNLDLQIIPVGIYYSNYTNRQSKVNIIFGKPITLKKYKELYQEHQNKAMLGFRDDLTAAISELAINIPSDENYLAYEHARELADSSILKKQRLKNTNLNKLNVDKKLIDKMADKAKNQPEWIKDFQLKSTDYFLRLKKNKLKDHVIEYPKGLLVILSMGLFSILSFPVVILASVLHPLQFILPILILPKIKDPQFHSSFRFALYYILSMILYPITFALIWVFVDIWWAVGTIVLMPILANLAFKWFVLWAKTGGYWKWFKLKNHKQGRIIQQQREQLMNELADLI